MISERYLSHRGKTLQEIYDETTEYYVTDRRVQARNNLLAMSAPQKKEYFFQVLALYPDDRDFLDFIMSLI